MNPAILILAPPGIAFPATRLDNATLVMRRSALLLAVIPVGFVLAQPRVASADRFWTLQLRGGGVILASDPPEERGNVLVFHRYPGRELSSIRSEEVRRITIAQGPAKKAPRSLDGEVMVFGRDADPPDWRDRPRRLRISNDETPDGAGEAGSGSESGYGYGYGYGAPPPAPVPPRRVPPLVRPNGFPVVPGIPGSMQPPIGPNGFPVLTVTPPPMEMGPPPVMRRPR
jgi:hypothetical protein